MSALPCVGVYQPRKGLISPLTSRGRWSWVRPSDRSIAARTAVPASRSGGSIPGAASLEGREGGTVGRVVRCDSRGKNGVCATVERAVEGTRGLRILSLHLHVAGSRA